MIRKYLGFGLLSQLSFIILQTATFFSVQMTSTPWMPLRRVCPKVACLWVWPFGTSINTLTLRHGGAHFVQTSSFLSYPSFNHTIVAMHRYCRKTEFDEMSALKIIWGFAESPSIGVLSGNRFDFNKLTTLVFLLKSVSKCLRSVLKLSHHVA